MEVLVAQLCPVPGDLARNAERVAEVVTGLPQADVAVFPELFLSGYDLARVPALALAPDAAVLEPVRSAAADTRTAILVGFAERGQGGELYNSLAVLDESGRLAAVYRKVQLFGDERDVFMPGDRLIVVPLAGHRVGPLVCFDAEFPELARALGAAGADVLVTASANMEPYYADHELATRARALDNRLPHVYVNRVGEQAGLRFVGGSRVIGPDGSVQAQCPQQEESISIVSVEPAQGGDEAVGYLAQVPERLPVHVIDAVSGGAT
jgi:predicted amidohydrolase